MQPDYLPAESHGLARRPRPAAAAAVLLWLVTASGAAAQPRTAREAAREHYARGHALFKAEKYAEALAELLAAYELEKDPSLVYNIALASEKAGELKTALAYYRKYLEEGTDSSYRALATSHVADLTDRLSRCRLRLEVSAPGATIRVDGEVVGTSPVPTLFLRPGPHRLSASLAGHDPWESEVVAPSGGELVVGARLERTMGRLVVETDQTTLADTSIQVDGTDLGIGPAEAPGRRTTERDVPLGRHALLCRKSGLPTFSDSFEVDSRDVRIVTCRFESVRPAEPSSTSAWVTLGLGLGATAAGAAFLARYLVDLDAFEGETSAKEADTLPPDNAIVAAVLLTVGAGASVTSVFLFPSRTPPAGGTQSPVAPGVSVGLGPDRVHVLLGGTF